MAAKGKLCSLRDQHYITVPLTAMTQLKDPGHVRERKQGEINAGQQVSVGAAQLGFLKHGQKQIEPSVPENQIFHTHFRVILST